MKHYICAIFIIISFQTFSLEVIKTDNFTIMYDKENEATAYETLEKLEKNRELVKEITGNDAKEIFVKID